jgi:hypothetical protein
METLNQGGCYAKAPFKLDPLKIALRWSGLVVSSPPEENGPYGFVK